MKSDFVDSNFLGISELWLKKYYFFTKKNPIMTYKNTKSLPER